jgi:hypothetical protein
MENVNSILENPLLLVAILLLLVFLPLAFRKKKKTKLDRAIERFEKEKSRAVAEGKTDKSDIPRKKTNHSTFPKKLKNGAIQPFPEQEVVEGTPIPKNDAADSTEAFRKQVKLDKQKLSIAPDENKVTLKKASPDPQNKKKSAAPAKDQKPKSEEYLHTPALDDNENKESEGSWIEAEIPGLIMESPPPPKSSENVPTFKKENPPEVKKTQKAPKTEKQVMKVKNLAPESEEKKDLKPIKRARLETVSPKLGIEISESKSKAVEIKAPVASHKGVAKKKAGQKKVKKSSSKAGNNQKTEAVVTAVRHRRKDAKTSPKKLRPKPFLLSVKYLDKGESKTASPVSDEILSNDMADTVIARLNALQNNLENQLVSIPGEPTPGKYLVSKDVPRDQTQDSFSDLKGKFDESSDNNGVSLKKLDSFLFTATQRKIENDL